MSRAGRRHPDQAERAHRGSAQSRRHRQHHHAGGHGLRNELLNGTVDPSEEIQTHHKRLLRALAHSKIFYVHFIHTFIHTHSWAKSSLLSRRERSSLLPRRQNRELLFCVSFTRLFLSLLWILRLFSGGGRGGALYHQGPSSVCAEVQEGSARRRTICSFLYSFQLRPFQIKSFVIKQICDDGRHSSLEMTSPRR